MARLDGTSLFAGIYSGLTNTYSVLSNQFKDGVTLANLSSGDATTTLSNNSMSQTFKQYLTTNFSSVDKNADGTITADELTNLTNAMSNQGLTRDQITQLACSGNYSSETVEQILTHFDQIDANHDGKVTNAEIQAYGINSDAENKKIEYANQRATDMSTFYSDNSSASNADSSSLLSYKWMKSDN